MTSPSCVPVCVTCRKYRSRKLPVGGFAPIRDIQNWLVICFSILTIIELYIRTRIPKMFQGKKILCIQEVCPLVLWISKIPWTMRNTVLCGHSHLEYVAKRDKTRIHSLINYVSNKYFIFESCLLLSWTEIGIPVYTIEIENWWIRNRHSLNKNHRKQVHRQETAIILNYFQPKIWKKKRTGSTILSLFYGKEVVWISLSNMQD